MNDFNKQCWLPVFCTLPVKPTMHYFSMYDDSDYCNDVNLKTLDYSYFLSINKVDPRDHGNVYFIKILNHKVCGFLSFKDALRIVKLNQL
jgi:hypothetical protein